MELIDKQIDDAINEMTLWFVIDDIEEKMDTFKLKIKLSVDEQREFNRLRKELVELLTKID